MDEKPFMHVIDGRGDLGKDNFGLRGLPVGALLASQDSNVFRVSSEVANAAEKGEADGDTVVDLNRIGVQVALMPPPTTTNN